MGVRGRLCSWQCIKSASSCLNHLLSVYAHWSVLLIEVCSWMLLRHAQLDDFLWKTVPFLYSSRVQWLQNNDNHRLTLVCSGCKHFQLLSMLYDVLLEVAWWWLQTGNGFCWTLTRLAVLYLFATNCQSTSLIIALTLQHLMSFHRVSISRTCDI